MTVTSRETIFLIFFLQHVVTEVDLGTREGSNYEEHRTDFVSYASTNVRPHFKRKQ